MPSSFLSPTFIIGHIRIGSVEGASCVNLGNNYPTNFTSNKKHNQGFGSVSGDNNNVEGIRSALNDADILDMMNTDEMKDVPEWVKQLMLEQYHDEASEEEPADDTNHAPDLSDEQNGETPDSRAGKQNSEAASGRADT